MEQKSILLQARTSFPIAVDSLSRELRARPSGDIHIDRYKPHLGAGIHYLDKVVGRLIDQGENRGRAMFVQDSIWAITAWNNDDIFDMSMMVVTVLAKEFWFPRDPGNSDSGNWHFADVALALQYWARVPDAHDPILFPQNE
jgi:hypothetical protein